MAPRINTRERILEASLEQFNTLGERVVTTNHLAAHLGMSPGNLYYHFSNKQVIIAELFARYEAEVEGILQLPEGRAVGFEDKTQYLESLLDGIWRYRFLHRDLEHLLASDAQLEQRYRQFSQRCLSRAQSIYRSLVEVGILQMDEAQIEALTLNSWIILTSWVRFLCTTHGDGGGLSQALVSRGLYQVLALEDGYTTAQGREAWDALKARLYVPLEVVG